MPILKQRIKVVDSDGKLVVKVLEENGDPSINKDGEPLSISALVKSLKDDEAFAGAFNSSGLSGGGSKPTTTASKNVDTELFGSKRMAAARQAK